MLQACFKCIAKDEGVNKREFMHACSMELIHTMKLSQHSLNTDAGPRAPTAELHKTAYMCLSNTNIFKYLWDLGL